MSIILFSLEPCTRESYVKCLLLSRNPLSITVDLIAVGEMIMSVMNSEVRALTFEWCLHNLYALFLSPVRLIMKRGLLDGSQLRNENRQC